jgi:hypothetical protein
MNQNDSTQTRWGHGRVGRNGPVPAGPVHWGKLQAGPADGTDR